MEVGGGMGRLVPKQIECILKPGPPAWRSCICKIVFSRTCRAASLLAFHLLIWLSMLCGVRLATDRPADWSHWVCAGGGPLRIPHHPLLFFYLTTAVYANMDAGSAYYSVSGRVASPRWRQASLCFSDFFFGYINWRFGYPAGIFLKSNFLSRKATKTASKLGLKKERMKVFVVAVPIEMLNDIGFVQVGKVEGKPGTNIQWASVSPQSPIDPNLLHFRIQLKDLGKSFDRHRPCWRLKRPFQLETMNDCFNQNGRSKVAQESKLSFRRGSYW